MHFSIGRGYRLILAVTTAIWVVSASLAGPDESPPPNEPASQAELEKRIRELEDVVRQLKNERSTPRPAAPGGAEGEQSISEEAAEPTSKDIQKMVDSYLKSRDAQKKKDDDAKKKTADEQGYEVGSDLTFKASWKDGFNVETPNKDFRVHVGGRVHADAAWFAPDDNLNSVAFPLGTWNDGADLRRVRFRVDGKAYEVFDFVVEMDFISGVAGTTNHPVPTDVYGSITQLPWVGAVDVGHFKEPFAMDDYGTPDNYLVFMERATATDAFSPARNMGIMLHNTAWEDRIVWATGLFRTLSDNNSGNTFDYGDGEYAYTSRLAFVPYYANDGRCWFLVGAAYSHRMFQPNDAGVAGANPSRVRFSSRMPIRVNSPVLIDTGNQVAKNDDLLNAQAVLVLGPLQIQGEYYHADVRNMRRGLLPDGTFNELNPAFSGSYIQASYFLTGEYHPLERAYGRNGRVRPNEPYFLVHKGEKEGLGLGTGAWEIAARWDYVNLGSPALNAFPFAANVDTAGSLQSITVGLNWYLSPNTRFMWNYSHSIRHVSAPEGNGSVDALGTRMIFDF